MTKNPAQAIGRADVLGCLSVGREADVTVLKVVSLESPVLVKDTFGMTRPIKEVIVPVAVWRAGRPFPIASRDHDPI